MVRTRTPVGETAHGDRAGLRDHPLVAADERSVAHMSHALTGDERVTPVDAVDNMSTALGMAAANLAATLSPAYVKALTKPLGLVMRRIVSPVETRQICLYWPTRRVSSPAAEGFARYLEGYFVGAKWG